MARTVFHDALFDTTLEVTWGGGGSIAVLRVVDANNTIESELALDAKTATDLASQLLQFATQQTGQYIETIVYANREGE